MSTKTLGVVIDFEMAIFQPYYEQQMMKRLTPRALEKIKAYGSYPLMLKQARQWRMYDIRDRKARPELAFAWPNLSAGAGGR
ncbi:hypothetical protein ABS772_23695 [Methylorubrum podarium]|uniref:Uncharacterized protein n=1 Tax=Methylorubrum podarium TaxID=200476 RepID=A0ABV1QUA5_9HYPH